MVNALYVNRDSYTCFECGDVLFLDENHLAVLKKGVDIWNSWRHENPSIRPDLSEAHLYGASLRGANLREAILRGANLSNADLRWADLRGGVNLIGADLRGADLTSAHLDNADLGQAYLTTANLSKASLENADLRAANLQEANLEKAYLAETHFYATMLANANLRWANLSKADLCSAFLMEAILVEADLSGANLSRADLSRADLWGANLSRTNLSGTNLSGTSLMEAILVEADLNKANLSRADLWGADLSMARMIGVKLNGAKLTDCRVFGISAWGLIGLEDAEQSNLVVTPDGEPDITVDNLEVAQFIYLLINSKRIRSVIDTITSKVVLILGRFTPAERKAVLDAIRDELRKRDYLPILFDFEKPKSRNLTETVSTLAHMARFVIADITDARSIPQELERIVPRLPSVPVQPILLASAKEYDMFVDFKPYPWVLELYQYTDKDDLLYFFGEKVIAPAEGKLEELRKSGVP